MNDRPTTTSALDVGDDAASRRTPRRWLRIVVGIMVVSLIVAYVVYMSLGMPGMDHAQATPPTAAAVAATARASHGER